VLGLGLSACAGEGPTSGPPDRDALEAELESFLAENPDAYFCPMDLDVRSDGPGFCPRCRMALVSAHPDPLDYQLALEVLPVVPTPGQPVTLHLTVFDPDEAHVVSDFEVMHEKIFHLFVISQDLEFFAHEHPVQTGEGDFYLDIELPDSGMYQILADFYPSGATPQLVPKSFIVPGGRLASAELSADYTTPREGENLSVTLTTEPGVPVAGQETEMHFTVEPAEGLEEYIGAWGHMLAVSDDLIDTVHGHPFIADGGPEMLFHLQFPRARNYRVFVQFQRHGVVNTVYFDIPVEEFGL